MFVENVHLAVCVSPCITVRSTPLQPMGRERSPPKAWDGGRSVRSQVGERKISTQGVGWWKDRALMSGDARARSFSTAAAMSSLSSPLSPSP
jgi:hypothetical protein